VLDDEYLDIEENQARQPNVSDIETAFEAVAAGYSRFGRTLWRS